jgi:LmbE family N-acetylglucosaminyl deacetylase
MNFKKILVLAPHTDDGELGCGATIAKFVAEGADVFYVAFSICTRSLPKELDPFTLEREVKKATKVLGIKAENLFLYDFDVRHFPTHRQEILETLVKLKREIEPDLVLMPNADDIHQDHQTIYQEGLRAFKACTLLGYELPWNNFAFQTNSFVMLDENQLQVKKDALKCYESQMHRSYLNDKFIESWAITRGVQIGCKYAEAFQIIRLIL